MSQFLGFSRCMRAHGISDFPDPTTSPPPPAPGRTVSNDGVYLFIPITMNVNSPTYESAAAACRPRLGLTAAPVAPDPPSVAHDRALGAQARTRFRSTGGEDPRSISDPVRALHWRRRLAGLAVVRKHRTA